MGELRGRYKRKKHLHKKPQKNPVFKVMNVEFLNGLKVCIADEYMGNKYYNAVTIKVLERST